MSEVSVGVFTAYRDHWAQAQAASKGDTLFHHDTSPVRQACRTSTSGQPLDAESALYAHIFASEDIVPRSHFPPATLVSSSDADGTALTSTRPYFDFEFEIPIDKPVDFEGLYSATENQLMFVLDVLYASEVADCMKIPPPAAPRTAADVAAAVEETLWASHMRVGHPPNSTTSNALPKWKSRRCVMTLKAMLPITVVRGGTQTILPPPAHYLTPGLPAPVIRPGAHVVPVAPDFPIADPMFTDEPVADTIERLLEPHRGSSRYTGPRFPNSAMAIPDPARHYRQGQYAGVLWKKKIVAEERGFLPFHPEDVDPIGDERQQPFKV
ncbi:hypothetical protein K438DRAFT_1996599 [Mycena galopus ATCC 62051]|nr:hypothetical protein K438DRAFT_1996599 [Mycena galopus ATCC 62051]